MDCNCRTTGSHRLYAFMDYMLKNGAARTRSDHVFPAVQLRTKVNVTSSGMLWKLTGCGDASANWTELPSMEAMEAFGKTSTASVQDMDFFLPDTGPLSTDSYRKRLDTSMGTKAFKCPKSGVQVRYAYVSQRGYYPDAIDKANQDAFIVKKDVTGDPEAAFFGVFDGHGTCGAYCAKYAKDKVFNNMIGDMEFFSNPAHALANAVEKTNDQLHASAIDDSLSGTTAVAILMRGHELTIANVGDSRCIAAEMRGPDLIAVDLTSDQTPYRKDELERVKAAGARVLTLEQLDGLRDPNIQEWGTEEEDDGDPPRLWVPHGSYPGTAFTRSLGDAVAEAIGVVGTPEVSTMTITDKTCFLILATDGVWEFLTSQAVVDIVDQHEDLQKAAMAVCVEAYRAWLSTEARTDDITVIIIEVTLGKGLTANGSISRSASRGSNLGGSQHGNRSLTKSKSIRKGLARGSLALHDEVQPRHSEDSQAFLKPAAKSAEEERYLRQTLVDHPQFRLPEDKLAETLSYFRKRTVAEGEILIEKGQTGKYFYVVHSGTYALKIPAKPSSKPGEHEIPEQTVHRYAPLTGIDSTFGEIALVSGAKPYGGFIVARSAGEVWQLDKRAYKAAVQGSPVRITTD